MLRLLRFNNGKLGATVASRKLEKSRRSDRGRRTEMRDGKGVAVVENDDRLG